MKYGDHDYSGKIDPLDLDYLRYFSVGVFAYERKAKGTELKHGTVKVRVRGLARNPEKVYAKAREIVKLLDKSRYYGPRTVLVK